MKHFLVRFQERNGERTYVKHKAVELGDDEDIKQWAETYLKDYYGSNTRRENGSFYSPDGEVAIQMDGAVAVTEDEFRVLNKFLN